MLHCDGWEYAFAYHWLLEHACLEHVAVGIPMDEGIGVFYASQTPQGAQFFYHPAQRVREVALVHGARTVHASRDEALERGVE